MNLFSYIYVCFLLVKIHYLTITGNFMGQVNYLDIVMYKYLQHNIMVKFLLVKSFKLCFLCIFSIVVKEGVSFGLCESIVVKCQWHVFIVFIDVYSK